MNVLRLAHRSGYWLIRGLEFATSHVSMSATTRYRLTRFLSTIHIPLRSRENTISYCHSTAVGLRAQRSGMPIQHAIYKAFLQQRCRMLPLRK